MTQKPHPARSRKFIAAKRAAERHLPDHLPGLFYLTDPGRSPDPFRTTENLPTGSGVIYRHFGKPDRNDVARELRIISRRKGIKLLISNDPLLALQVDADGVHWPEKSLSQAKIWRRRFELMTASAHSRSAIQSASVLSLDATLVSTVFASASASASSPMGPLRFKSLARQAPLPIFALGGITSDNAEHIAEFGGIASISGIEEAFGF